MGWTQREQEAWRQLLLRRTDGLLRKPGHRLEAHNEAGREYFCRKAEVLVAAEEVADVAAELGALGAQVADSDVDLGLVRYRLPDGVRVHGAVQRLRRASRQADPLIAPNHVLFAAPKWCGGPGAAPKPAPALALQDGVAGAGVTIAVLDTGQSQESLSLPWMSAHVDARDVDPVDGDGDGRLDPQAGHGTFISGVLAQAAPGVRVVALRVLDGDGVTDELTVVRAVRQAVALGAQIVNLSLGGYTFSDQGTRAIDRALAKAGAVGVAAAGNDGVSRPFYPAASDRVIGVAALSRDGSRAPFSNHGPWVDACADGVELASTYVKGLEAQVWEADGVDLFTDAYAYWSGTSFAAPQVAAAIAVRAAQHGEDVATAAAAVLAAGPSRPGLGAQVTTSVRSTV